MPWFFSKNEDNEAEEEAASADNAGAGEKDELAKAVAEAEAALAEHSGANDAAVVAASARLLLQDQPGMPEPSAPDAEDGVDVVAAAGSAERPVADAAFERALLSKRRVQQQQQPSLRDASIAAVIS